LQAREVLRLLGGHKRSNQSKIHHYPNKKGGVVNEPLCSNRLKIYHYLFSISLYKPG